MRGSTVHRNLNTLECVVREKLIKVGVVMGLLIEMGVVSGL